jgi:hypothetical protein
MVDRLQPDKPAGSRRTLDQLEADLKIDEYALNDVCREHPTLLYRVARELTFAISRRDAAKVELKKIEGRMTLSMRGQARDDGEKITVDEIKALVWDSKQYVAAADQLAMRQEQVGEWAALKEGYDQRSYALNHMVDLYLANYYGNIERRESSEERDRNADRARERLDAMRRAAPYDRTRREENRDG